MGKIFIGDRMRRVELRKRRRRNMKGDEGKRGEEGRVIITTFSPIIANGCALESEVQLLSPGDEIRL